MTQSKVPGWEVAERAVHRGMSWRCAVHMYVPMPSWPAALELVPEASRKEVDEYLRTMADRARAVLATRKEQDQ